MSTPTPKRKGWLQRYLDSDKALQQKWAEEAKAREALAEQRITWPVPKSVFTQLLLESLRTSWCFKLVSFTVCAVLIQLGFAAMRAFDMPTPWFLHVYVYAMTMGIFIEPITYLTARLSPWPARYAVDPEAVGQPNAKQRLPWTRVSSFDARRVDWDPRLLQIRLVYTTGNSTLPPDMAKARLLHTTPEHYERVLRPFLVDVVGLAEGDGAPLPEPAREPRVYGWIFWAATLVWPLLAWPLLRALPGGPWFGDPHLAMLIYMAISLVAGPGTTAEVLGRMLSGPSKMDGSQRALNVLGGNVVGAFLGAILYGLGWLILRLYALATYGLAYG